MYWPCVESRKEALNTENQKQNILFFFTVFMYEMTEQHWHTKYTHRSNTIQNKHKHITSHTHTHEEREKETNTFTFTIKQTNKQQTQMGIPSVTHSLSRIVIQRDSITTTIRIKRKRINDCCIYISHWVCVGVSVARMFVFYQQSRVFVALALPHQSLGRLASKMLKSSSSNRYSIY